MNNAHYVPARVVLHVFKEHSFDVNDGLFDFSLTGHGKSPESFSFYNQRSKRINHAVVIPKWQPFHQPNQLCYTADLSTRLLIKK